MKNTASSLPSWSYPLLLALLAIVIFVGKLPPLLQAGVGVESLLFLCYLLLRSRQPERESRAVSNLLPLFPGHLLLLFAISLLSVPTTGLVYLWTIIPVATVLYDLIASRSIFGVRVQMSILAGLYCIIWAVLFFLLERIISLGRGLRENEEIMIAALFGVVSIVFLSLGTYRHWRASKL